MKRNLEILNDYYNARNSMRERARKVIKKYGKELDVIEIIKKRLIKDGVIDERDEPEDYSETLEESLQDEGFYSQFEDKHGGWHSVLVLKVRYNKTSNHVEAYVKEDGGDIEGWFDDYLLYDTGVYETILTFIED